MTNVLFVCLQNAGRSQMSQALFERDAAGTGHAARSAGTTPAARVHPEVVDRDGASWASTSPTAPRTPLTDDDARWADVVVTMGCGDSCPYIPGRRYLDWELTDPHGQRPRRRPRDPRRDRGPRSGPDRRAELRTRRP